MERRPEVLTDASRPVTNIFADDGLITMNRFSSRFLLALALGVTSGLRAQQKTSNPLDAASAEREGTDHAQQSATRGAWLKDSRFAMFIHWGLFSELGGRWNGKNYYGISEWVMNRAKIPAADYARVADQFNPTAFNAREWVLLAKAAGMRHIIITAKHHEGFAMFKSQASPFNIVDATPFKRDPLQELAAACAAEGLRLGFYYSQTQDWHEPDAEGNRWDPVPANRDFRRYLHTKAIPQVEELLRNYGPIAAIWFDTPGPITREESTSLVDLVHRLQPPCLVNSRIGNGLGDYETLGDQEIPRLPRPGLWESIDTTNDSWAFSFADQNWKSAREVAERLVRVVSRGGTYMLNVGPDGSGRIPAPAADTLREVGRWVAAHERAIHGAQPTPLPPLPWGECTARDGTLFLHVFQWPADGRLIVPGMTKATVRSARLMDGGANVRTESAADALVLHVPPLRPHALIPVVAVEVSGPVEATRDQYVLNGTVSRLDATTAQATGCTPKKVRWMEKFGDWKHVDSLGEWRVPGGSASWAFRTLQPGRFYVDVEYSATEKGDYSEWELKVDDNVRTLPLIDTGERAKRALWSGEFPRFRLYRAGVVDLRQPGAHALQLRPLDTGGAGVRIAGLILTPVE